MRPNIAQGTNTYVIPEPFERALKQLREMLNRDGFGIPMELDVAGRIRRELGVSLAPCRILCVDHPMALVEAIAIDPSGALFLPLRMVVAGRGPQTLVHLTGISIGELSGVPPAAKDSIVKLRNRLSMLLQAIGGRQPLCELTS